LYKAAVLQKCATGCARAAASAGGGDWVEMGGLPQTYQVPELCLSRWTEGDMGQR